MSVDSLHALQADSICTDMCDILKVRTLTPQEKKDTDLRNLQALYGGAGWARARVCLQESSMTTLVLRGAVVHAFQKRRPEMTDHRDVMYVCDFAALALVLIAPSPRVCQCLLGSRSVSIRYWE